MGRGVIIKGLPHESKWAGQAHKLSSDDSLSLCPAFHFIMLFSFVFHQCFVFMLSQMCLHCWAWYSHRPGVICFVSVGFVFLLL